jgi:hypothetical protein
MSDNEIAQEERGWEYAPASVSSVPAGWRALYRIEKPEPGEPDWKTIPLIGWGVFHLIAHMRLEGEEWSREEGDVIEGVVIGGFGSPACALDTPNFLFYLGPDDPDPNSEQLNRPVRQPGRRVPTRQRVIAR